MSVQSEIDRIEQAKADIKEAIVKKDVTVPANAKIDNMAVYINRIQVGGTCRSFTTGAVSQTQQNANYTIDTGLDSVGYFVISKISGSMNGLESYTYDGSRQGGVVRPSDGVYGIASDLMTISGGRITLKSSSTALGKSGCGINGTYRWMAREE